MSSKQEVRNHRRQQGSGDSTAWLPYLARPGLLTPGERRFYHQGLRAAINDRYLVSFKVRLADVITVKNWQSKYGRKIAQKHLDFVLTTARTTRIVAAIELNDATHESPDRQRRDYFLAQALRSAGIPLITFPIYQKYDHEKIRRRIEAAIRHRSCLAAGRRCRAVSTSTLCGVEPLE